MPLDGRRSLGPTHQPHGGKEDKDVIPSFAFSITALFSLLLSVLLVSFSLPSSWCHRFPLPGPHLCFIIRHTTGARISEATYLRYPMPMLARTPP
jgi:hypothetical protein